MNLFDVIQRLLGRDVAREGRAIRHGMDRRRFLLTALAGTVVAATVDLDQVLWTPTPQIVVPDLTGVDWGAGDDFSAVNHWVETDRHTFVTPDWITQEALRLLKHELQFSKMLSRSYEMEGARVGTVLNIRTPARFTVNAGEAFDPTDIVCEIERVSVTNQVSVEMCTSPELVDGLTREQYSRMMIRPAVASLAQHIKTTKMNVFTEPGVPVGIEYAGVHRSEDLAIRGCQFYSPHDRVTHFRLDVLGGHSDVVAEGDHDGPVFDEYGDLRRDSVSSAACEMGTERFRG